MKDEEILKLFYDCIIKEATTGRIDCFRYFNLPFNTIIRDGEEVRYDVDSNSPYLDGVNTFPCLFINNREIFNNLLLEYVHKALEFYDDSNFYEEVLSGKEYEETKMISKEKWIICALIANMSEYDFSTPYSYLQRRIAMFDNKIMDEDEIDLGYVESLKGRIIVKQEKEKIDNETPYVLKIKLHSDELEQDYYFPDVRIGNCGEYGIIYSIQRELYNNRDDEYVKYVDRRLRKIDQGLDVKNDTYENFGDGNLKDITPSFLIAALVGSMVSKNNSFELVNILIERWNAKRIANRVKASSKENKEEFILYEDRKQVELQYNLTQKFLRLFRRLDYHVDGMNFGYTNVMSFFKVNDSLMTNNNLIREIIDVILSKRQEKTRN